MKKRLFNYLDRKFPDLASEVSVRFELGDHYENGSNERINQVIKRVTALFEEVFQPDDYIYVYIKDWGTEEDVMYGNTTPNYLYDLLTNQSIEEETLFELDEDYDEKTGETFEIKNEYKVRIVNAQVKSIAYKEILEGIGNYEQGREPSIGHSVYFISSEKDIVFNMYDDRGCIIYALEKERLLPIYFKFRKWIVDYHRVHIDQSLEQGLFNIRETALGRYKRLKSNRRKVKDTGINLFYDNTCFITHELEIPSFFAEECVNEMKEIGFEISIEKKVNDSIIIKAMKMETLACVDSQSEIVSLYARKYKGKYNSWSAIRACK